jgi:hypothetical protein
MKNSDLGCYPLADGSLSSDYDIGDQFEVVDKSELIVTLTCNDGYMNPFFGNRCYAWSRLKPYKKFQKQDQKTFTKVDLKDGMVVTYREPGERIFYKGKFLHEGRFGSEVTNFEDDLTHKRFSEYDIVKVTFGGDVLWERKEDLPEETILKKQLLKKELDEVKSEQAGINSRIKLLEDKLSEL